MRALMGYRKMFVFVVLVCATFTNFALAEGAVASKVAGAVVILVATFKIRLIFVHFMELSIDTRPWRWVFECWVIAISAMILFFYLFGFAY